MKRNHIGFFIGLFFIVAFIVTIVASTMIIQKIIEDEQYKQAYYTTQYGLDRKQATTNEPVKFPVQSHLTETESPQYEAIKKIKALHALADYLLLGSKFNNYTEGSNEGWEDILESQLLLADQYKQIAEAMVEEEDIVKDMNNLYDLTMIATTLYEPDALRFIHRILHDLDLYGYPESGTPSSDYFGATHAVASSNPTQLSAVNGYIAEKKLLLQ